MANIKCGDEIKVIKLMQNEANNPYGRKEDITCFIGEKGMVTNILDGRLYGVEFYSPLAQVARLRTGYVFDSSEIEITS